MYLDVAFFHPFADGNARAALVALVHVLAREGIVPPEAGPELFALLSRPEAVQMPGQGSSSRNRGRPSGSVVGTSAP